MLTGHNRISEVADTLGTLTQFIPQRLKPIKPGQPYPQGLSPDPRAQHPFPQDPLYLVNLVLKLLDCLLSLWVEKETLLQTCRRRPLLGATAGGRPLYLSNPQCAWAPSLG